MKNFLICSLAVICIFSCTKSAPPQEFVGEWKNTDISYYYDNAKLDLAIAPYVDSRSYRIWLWEEDTAMSSLEYSLDAEFRPSFIINSDGSALYGNNSIKATYSANSISFQIDGKKGLSLFMITPSMKSIFPVLAYTDILLLRMVNAWGMMARAIMFLNKLSPGQNSNLPRL